MSFSRTQRRIASLNIESILNINGVFQDVLGVKDAIWGPWPRTLHVLENALSLVREQHFFFDLLKMGQDYKQCCFVLEHTRELAKNNFWRLIFVKNLQICGRRPFFLFYLFNFFFWKTLLRCVLDPWSRAFLPLAPRRFVLGFGFFCVLGLRPSVFNSNSDC